MTLTLAAWVIGGAFAVSGVLAAVIEAILLARRDARDSRAAGA